MVSRTSVIVSSVGMLIQMSIYHLRTFGEIAATQPRSIVIDNDQIKLRAHPRRVAAPTVPLHKVEALDLALWPQVSGTCPLAEPDPCSSHSDNNVFIARRSDVVGKPFSCGLVTCVTPRWGEQGALQVEVKGFSARTRDCWRPTAAVGKLLLYDHPDCGALVEERFFNIRALRS